MKSKNEIVTEQDNKENRILKIKNFLKNNKGRFYRDDELGKLLNLKCIGTLIKRVEHWRYREWSWKDLKKHGVKQYQIDVVTNDEYCGYHAYYGWE